MSCLSRVRRASSGGGGPAVLTTLLVADGTIRDVNAARSGAGLRDVGDVITCTLTTQLTAYDGHQEGVLVYWPMPAAWRADGTQSILFIIDQATIPTVAGGGPSVCAGMLADIGASQAAQVGRLYGVYTVATQVRPIYLDATVRSGQSLSLNTFGRSYVRYTPNWDDGVLVDGVIEPWSRTDVHALVANSSSQCVVLANTMTAPRLCVSFNTQALAATEYTLAARVRYVITDFLPLADR